MSLLQRLRHFLTKPVFDPAVVTLYNSCVAQARRIEFYQAYAVPDTLDGRFDLLLLHVFMVMHRLDAAADIKQQLFDLMFDDMDRNLREMGVGDMSVGKKIRPMISAFYGRGQAYQKALAGSDEELAATLRRNLYGKASIEASITSAMAQYVRKVMVQLKQQSLSDLREGQINFPVPVV